MDLNQWPTNRLLKTAARLTETTETNHFRDLGTTPVGFAVLRVLSQGQAVSQSELARQIRISPETLGKVIDRLERSALIVRVGSAVEERNARISITPEGRNLVDNAYTLEEEQERTLGSDEQLRTELINRIRALGLDSDARQKHPHLKLVPKSDSQEDDDSSATG